MIVVMVRDDDVLEFGIAEGAEHLHALVERLIVAESGVDDGSLVAVPDEEDVRRVGLREPRQVDVQACDVRCDLGRQVSPSVQFAAPQPSGARRGDRTGQSVCRRGPADPRGVHQVASV